MRASDCQMETDDYVDSNEWKLLEHPAKKNVIKYPCCVEPYPDLTYTIRVKRIAVFYSFILVLPCVLLSMLTLVSFWLPPESPAKVLLGQSVTSLMTSRVERLADALIHSLFSPKQPYTYNIHTLDKKHNNTGCNKRQDRQDRTQ